MSTEKLYQIALTQLPNIGPVTAKKLISYCGSAESVFRSSEKSLRKIPSIGAQLAATIKLTQPIERAKRELEFIKNHRIQSLFFLDSDYPSRLKQFDDAPVMLYYRGEADLNAPRTLGVIGTRQPSPRGLAYCDEIIEGISDLSPVIISGLAFGIDIQAHRAALRSGLNTIAVLGHGLDRVYPFRHRQTAREMLVQGGLLTEFPSNTKPDRENFPMRNRIVAALCDAMLVVESGRSGGSLITARFANQYHKDVFAIPGRPKDIHAAGCNHLIKTHQAGLIESADDLVYAMGWAGTIPGAGIQQQLFEDLSEDELEIVDRLKAVESLHFDRLVRDTRWPPGKLSGLLLGLEFKGIIKSVPGSCFVLV